MLCAVVPLLHLFPFCTEAHLQQFNTRRLNLDPTCIVGLNYSRVSRVSKVSQDARMKLDVKL